MKIDITKIVSEELDKILGRLPEEDQEQPSEPVSPSSRVEFKGVTYRFKTGVNRNPTKLGIKLQFTPIAGFDSSDPEFRPKQDAELQKFLNTKFKEYGQPGFIVDFDTDVPNPNTTGFIICLALIESLVDSFFDQQENASTETPDDRSDQGGDEPDSEQ